MRGFVFSGPVFCDQILDYLGNADSWIAQLKWIAGSQVRNLNCLDKMFAKYNNKNWRVKFTRLQARKNRLSG